MKKVQIEFDELPFPTLERFGLTREMIEDLPMRVLDDICDGRHSPVLPVRVTDEHGGQIESRSRFAFIRMDNGQVDVVFYPALKSSPLERYDEAQQKQLLDGKAIVADVEMADGRRTCWLERLSLPMLRMLMAGAARLSCRLTPRRNR